MKYFVCLYLAIIEGSDIDEDYVSDGEQDCGESFQYHESIPRQIRMEPIRSFRDAPICLDTLVELLAAAELSTLPDLIAQSFGKDPGRWNSKEDKLESEKS